MSERSCLTCAYDWPDGNDCAGCGPKKIHWRPDGISRKESEVVHSPITKEIDILLYCINRIPDETIRAEVASSFLNVMEALELAAKAGRLSLV